MTAGTCFILSISTKKATKQLATLLLVLHVGSSSQENNDNDNDIIVHLDCPSRLSIAISISISISEFHIHTSPGARTLPHIHQHTIRRSLPPRLVFNQDSEAHSKQHTDDTTQHTDEGPVILAFFIHCISLPHAELRLPAKHA